MREFVSQLAFKKEVKEILKEIRLTADSDELTTVAKRKVVALLGGKGAPAYKQFNRKAFSDLYHELHKQFDVNKICAIKRKDLESAK